MAKVFFKVASIILLLSIPSCKKKEVDREEVDEKSNKAEKSKRSSNVHSKTTTYGWKKYKRSDYDIEYKDYSKILVGAVRGKFASLDKVVSSFEDEYPSGKTKRTVFYYVFRGYGNINNVDAEKWFPSYVSSLKEWRRSGNHPEVATIALANFYVSMAWYYRGSGFADTVSKQSWERFNENINKAQEALNSSKLELTNDPGYFVVKILLARASGANLESTINCFKEGQKKHPNYLPLYVEINEYLQQKWHGSSERHWHEFLKTAITEDATSDSNKQMIYSEIVRRNVKSLVEEYDLNEIFTYFSIDKEDYLKGLELRCETYPNSTNHVDDFLYYAHLLKDEKAVINALKLTKGCYNAKRWKKHTWFNHLDTIMDLFPETEPLIRLDKN